MEKNHKKIMTKPDIDQALRKMAQQIVEQNAPLDEVVLVGIRSRGADLAQRINKIIDQITQISLRIGVIDTTLYRDDISNASFRPVLKKTELNFPITNKHIILIDDVLYTGRTIRAALDALVDLGRPKTIKLAVLIDRGHRELPICADYIGLVLETSHDESIKVTLEEVEEEDAVLLLPFPEETKW